MSSHTYPVPASWKKRAFVDEVGYRAMYAESVKAPAKFWAKHAKRLDWFKAPTKIKNTSFDYDHVSIKWFEDMDIEGCHAVEIGESHIISHRVQAIQGGTQCFE